ncbi:MAG: hypothetical protein ACXAD7_05970 [Candidatus Kariarchaeaceae archaeon]|jgi:hypothetical protein
MSKGNNKLKSGALYREESLYYDMGFRFAQTRGRKAQKAIDKDFTGYLLLISLGLHFLFDVNQFLTIVILVLIYLYRAIIEKEGSYRISASGMLALLVATTVDHKIGGVSARPGKLFDSQLTTVVWLLELVWVIAFGIQIIITLQPHTPILSKQSSVQPETKEANENYIQLIKRLEGSEFALYPLDKQVDIQGLQKTFQGIITYLLALVGVAVLLNLLLWRIVGSFGGGINLLEEYFVSGMSLVLFILLIVFSKNVFPEREIEENELEGQE